ncbi:hypothetical protein PV327_007838 [Microctonus hyperodae]|uniref:Peptidase M12B domain-containing protein n=1 Tax=Microctonus hyperodae TaxID=165561 RepID=A0AA39G0R0_MICHY|nr:hypothetical protein PV327_007838 [Microctonus hyperodae]
MKSFCRSLFNRIIISERLKRAPFYSYDPPDVLEAIIKDGDEEISIKWERVKRHLVNENLPVYIAQSNSWGPNHLRSNVMKDLGKFILYHNITHKSAIMYLYSTDELSGVIGRSLFIRNLPIDQLIRPLDVGGQYVKRLPLIPHGPKTLSETTQSHFKSYPNKRAINSIQLNNTNLRTRRNVKSEHFYIEILLFITHDVYKFFKAQAAHLFFQQLIAYYIIHFNCVDMIFANLPTNDFQIFINLAGIINEGVFSKITNYLPLMDSNNRGIDIDQLFDNFQHYLNYFDFPFPKDSFDHILLSTGRILQFRENYVFGAHSDTKNIFKERQLNPGSSIVPMSIVQSLDPYMSYCAAAHEIGHALGIEQNDPFDKGITLDGAQCYGIMQQSNYHCSQCIKWSSESLAQLIQFTRVNQNRCFLLNKPRSLYPPGTSMISLSPCRQCQCFGFGCQSQSDSQSCSLYHSSNSCHEPLLCKKKEAAGLKLESTILPLDGTPCGEHKVCWGEKCVKINEPFCGWV